MNNIKTNIQEKGFKRHTPKILKGNFAAANGARLCNVDFIPAYPITPQTTIVEELSRMVADGELDATYINMDSEHSVFAAAKGAAISGARVFTATSGQGLFYAHEVLHAIAHYRLPMVVCNVGRPSIPWNIWADQTDSIAQRDTGWIQIYTETAQEVLDTIIQGYIITETLDIPVMVVLDAFYLSHTSENVWVPDQDLVDEFLPAKQLKGTEIDGYHPKAIGGLVPPDEYEKFELTWWQDALKVEELVNNVGKKFGEHFGREYGAIEAVNINENTKVVFVTTSTITTTVRGLLENHPEVGILKIRLLKPFPKKTVLETLKPLKDDAIIVPIERNFLGGREGALFQEMTTALYGKRYFKMYDVFAGMGGKDVSPKTIAKILLKLEENPDQIIWIDFE